MLPTTNALRGRAPALTLVLRGLWLRLLAINLASTKPLPLPPLSEQGPSLLEDNDHLDGEPIQEEDEGLYIPSFLEEALGGYGNLQIKMACTMQTQEKHDKKCFICQSGDHLMKDHYKEKMGWGPSSQRGLSKTSQLGRWPKPLCPVEQYLREPLQSEGCTLSKSRSLLSVYRPQKLGQSPN